MEKQNEGIRRLQEAIKEDAGPEELKKIAEEVKGLIPTELIKRNLDSADDTLALINLAVLMGKDRKEAELDIARINAVNGVLEAELENRLEKVGV